MTLAQLRAVRTVLRRLATPAEGQPDAEAVFRDTMLKGSRLAFPRHAQRKADAQVGWGGLLEWGSATAIRIDRLIGRLTSSIS